MAFRNTLRIPFFGQRKVQLTFPRGAVSLVLVLTGAALSLFSFAVAFGWDRGPFSLAGTVIAILGLSLMFGGYWLSRNSDGAPLAAACLKAALGFGSMFLVLGIVDLFLPKSLPTPTGYFIAVGCLCIFGLVQFRAYTRHR